MTYEWENYFPGVLLILGRLVGVAVSVIGKDFVAVDSGVNVGVIWIGSGVAVGVGGAASDGVRTFSGGVPLLTISKLTSSI